MGDHDENVDFDRAAEIVGDRAAARGAAPALDRALRARRRARARARDHPRRHQVRVRPPRRRHDRAGRRGAAPPTPRASGPPTATSPGAVAAELRQAVRARLGRRRRAGTRRRRRPPLPADVVEGTRERYVDAYERIAGEPLPALARAQRARREGAGARSAPRRASSTRRARPWSALCPRSASRASATCASAGMVELEVEDTGARARDVRAAACQPADRGLRGPGGRGGRAVRFGVVRFPGSLRRGRRAAWPAGASPTPSCSGTATATSGASTPWSCPAASPTGTTCAWAPSRASRP